MRPPREQAPIYFTGWLPGYADPEYFLRLLFHSQSRTNEGGFAHPPFDELIERARQERSDRGRLALFHDADRMAVADRVAVIPLVYGRSLAVVKPRVHGWWEFGKTSANFADLEVSEPGRMILALAGRLWIGDRACWERSPTRMAGRWRSTRVDRLPASSVSRRYDRRIDSSDGFARGFVCVGGLGLALGDLDGVGRATLTPRGEQERHPHERDGCADQVRGRVTPYVGDTAEHRLNQTPPVESISASNERIVARCRDGISPLM